MMEAWPLACESSVPAGHRVNQEHGCALRRRTSKQHNAPTWVLGWARAVHRQHERCCASDYDVEQSTRVVIVFRPVTVFDAESVAYIASCASSVSWRCCATESKSPGQCLVIPLEEAPSAIYQQGEWSTTESLPRLSRRSRALWSDLYHRICGIGEIRLRRMGTE